MKRFNKFLAALLVLSLCLSMFAVTGAMAASKVRITGKCHLRSGPGLGYSSKAIVPKGASVTYKGSSRKDGRGVRWYKISYKGRTGWVSSRYASLSKSSSSHSSSSSSSGSHVNYSDVSGGEYIHRK